MNWRIVHIGCVVEGHGEVEALPVLIRKIGQEFNVAAVVPRPIRISRSKLVKADELKRAVQLAVNNLGGPGGVIVLIDADDDCPRDLAPQMLARAQEVRPDVPMAVVLAKREYEGWFLASASALAGRRGLTNPLAGPADPETIRDAKGWLTDHMEGGRVYSETLDQAALTEAMDTNLARQANSFDKCYRDLRRLMGA